jgi:hypothetical protein
MLRITLKKNSFGFEAFHEQTLSQGNKLKESIIQPA